MALYVKMYLLILWDCFTYIWHLRHPQIIVLKELTRPVYFLTIYLYGYEVFTTHYSFQSQISKLFSARCGIHTTTIVEDRKPPPTTQTSSPLGAGSPREPHLATGLSNSSSTDIIGSSQKNDRIPDLNNLSESYHDSLENSVNYTNSSSLLLANNAITIYNNTKELISIRSNGSSNNHCSNFNNHSIPSNNSSCSSIVSPGAKSFSTTNCDNKTFYDLNKHISYSISDDPKCDSIEKYDKNISYSQDDCCPNESVADAFESPATDSRLVCGSYHWCRECAATHARHILFLEHLRLLHKQVKKLALKQPQE